MNCYKCNEQGIYQCCKCPNKTCYEHMWYQACDGCWDDMTKDWNPFPEPMENLK